MGKPTHFLLGPLSFKLRLLAKKISEDVIQCFLGLITPAALPSSIASGFCQAGEGRQPRIRRLLEDRMRTQVMLKPRREGQSPPSSIAPQVLP